MRRAVNACRLPLPRLDGDATSVQGLEHDPTEEVKALIGEGARRGVPPGREVLDKLLIEYGCPARTSSAAPPDVFAEHPDESKVRLLDRIGETDFRSRREQRADPVRVPLAHFALIGQELSKSDRTRGAPPRLVCGLSFGDAAIIFARPWRPERFVVRNSAVARVRQEEIESFIGPWRVTACVVREDLRQSRVEYP